MVNLSGSPGLKVQVMCEGIRHTAALGRRPSTRCLMMSDPASVVTTGWRPEAGEFGCVASGHYGIVDVLDFAAAT